MPREPRSAAAGAAALPADIGEALARADPGLLARVKYLDEVDSTNDEALELAAAGAVDGTAVLAGLQRVGRGRRGRSWFSPPEAGLYLSVVVRPCDWYGSPALVTLGAGVAAAHAIRRACGLPVELKWPNDLVIGRPWRKLGGVLSEAVTVAGRVDAVVVGIGVNLRSTAYPPELVDRATAIETELGRAIDRGALVAAVFAELGRVVARMRSGDTGGMCDEWRALAVAGLRHEAVRWQAPDGWRRGRVVTVDDEGALVVEVDERQERIVAGEVIWERLADDRS